jgi:hypothetical protein
MAKAHFTFKPCLWEKALRICFATHPPPPASAMPDILLAIPHLILYTASKENSIYGCNNFISSMAIPDAAESNAALDM